MNKIITLCGQDGCCPAIEFTGDSVKIGEEGNMATLKKEEWNALVDMIHNGKLKKA